MPTIIRHALFRKLSSLPEWQRLQKDFEIVSGLELYLADNLGRVDVDEATSKASGAGQKKPCREGKKCQRLCQELLQQAVKRPAFLVDERGWIEAAVPVGLSGISVGFFVFFGMQCSGKSGGKRVGGGLGACEEMTEDRVWACLRWLEMAASHVAAKLISHAVKESKVMPRPIGKACRIIRERALRGEIHLPEVAHECSISQGHLSRLFHRSTGITFGEYIARFRAEHAKGLLLHSERNVTACALESGFQSISQFHRVFRRVYGMSPRQWLIKTGGKRGRGTSKDSW